jgi:hypothetical protein
MTVDPNSIDLAAVMAEHLETAEPDLLRELLRTLVQVLMSADADAACGAEYGTNSGERSNTRNGYRPRGWDTRAPIDRTWAANAAAGTPARGSPSGNSGRTAAWQMTKSVVVWLGTPLFRVTTIG